MTILQRYVLGEFVKTFLLALAVLMLVFFLGTSLQMVRKFKVLEAAFVLQVLPHMFLGAITLTLPFSVLVGCTLTFSRLSHDNEITAMRAGGVHFNHIIWPVIVCALGLSGLAFYLSAEIVPRAYLKKRKLASHAIKLFYSTLVGTEPGTIPYFPGYRIYFSAYRDKMFHDLVIHRIDSDRVSEEIMAARGELLLDTANLRARLVLEHGSLAHVSYKQEQVYLEVKEGQKLSKALSDYTNIKLRTRSLRQSTVWAGFEKYVVELEIPSDTGKREHVNPKTLTRAELEHEIAKLADKMPGLDEELARDKQNMQAGNPPRLREAARAHASFITKHIKREQRALNRFRTTRHGRVALSLACLVVVLLGIPLGILVRHSNKLVSFAIAAVPVVGIYYPLMMAGEALGESGALPPALAMWGGNVIVGAIGGGLLAWLYRR